MSQWTKGTAQISTKLSSRYQISAPDVEPSIRALCAAMISLAAFDATEPLEEYGKLAKQAVRAREWFLSDEDEICTFIWCCNIISVPHEGIRNRVIESVNNGKRISTIMRMHA